MCQSIVGPLRVKSHLSEGMQIATICHVEMAEKVAALRAAVSSAAEFMLGRSPTKAFKVEVVDKLAAEF
jgi:hypothetical protein